jgi:hypothetical protein
LLEKALRIMDALLKALEKRGYCVGTAPAQTEEKRDYYGRSEQIKHPPKTFVSIGNHVIGLGLYEETEYVRPPTPRPPSNAPFEVYWKWRQTPLPPRRPTGSLTLAMKNVRDVGRKSWTDGKPRRLEDSLNMFVRALMRTSEVLERRRIENEEHQRRWKAQQEEYARQEQARREEQERIERLNTHLKAWRTAREIRAFVDDARRVLGGKQAAPETETYLRWAQNRADAIDPCRNLRSCPSTHKEDGGQSEANAEPNDVEWA